MIDKDHGILPDAGAKGPLGYHLFLFSVTPFDKTEMSQLR